MGQEDVINFLKKCKKDGLGPQTAKQLAVGTGVAFTTMSRTLKTMRDYGGIKYIEEKICGRQYLYKYLI
jgi:DNA-binding transcriptional regulator YhcF (GntR family)